MFRTLAEMIEEAQGGPQLSAYIVGGNDSAVLEALRLALELGRVNATLLGDAGQIHIACRAAGLNPDQVTILHQPDLATAARVGAHLASQQPSSCLMKGLVSTADFLRGALDREVGLSTGTIISHVAVMQVPTLQRLILSTDGAVNIVPTLDQKAQLIRNMLVVARALGVHEPKIACLAAIEAVNPRMVSTVHAAELARMGKAGAFPGAVVDGPLGFDNVVSPRAAEHKGIAGAVAGQADALLAPDLETAVVVVKSAVYLGGARTSGIVVGASRPIVLTSRADTPEAKLASIALAVHVARCQAVT